MNILVINCGSSTIKFRLLDMAGETFLAGGLLERIGEPGSSLSLKGPAESWQFGEDVPDHISGIGFIFRILEQTGMADTAMRIGAIGHRVVHGGEHFSRPTMLDDGSLARIRRTFPLAPLHNPINMAGIEACLAHFPGLPQVAVFDTAFHQTMPEFAWRYALPDDWYAGHGVRRYGFHGTSHACVARQAAAFLGKPMAETNLITLHLGNGASACAIRAGRSVDTSMGMTPLEGLVMGTRCGDMDPAIPAFMEREIGLSPEQVDDALNRQSGLRALCGEYDMRLILEHADRGDARAALALDIYAYRLRKYIGAYLAALGRTDAIVFTGGIGEHAAPVRARVCAGLEGLGIVLDDAANGRPCEAAMRISRSGSPVAVLAIPTDEELEIARQTLACLADSGH